MSGTRNETSQKNAIGELLKYMADLSILVPPDRIVVGHDDRFRLVLEDVPYDLHFEGISDRATLEQVVMRGPVVGGSCACWN